EPPAADYQRPVLPARQDVLRAHELRRGAELERRPADGAHSVGLHDHTRRLRLRPARTSLEGCVMPASTVGFIGLGNLGGPMAYMLRRAGWPVYLWARRPESLEPFAGTGAVPVPTLEELAREVDLIAVMVGGDADVEEVVIGRGVLGAMRPGTA